MVASRPSVAAVLVATLVLALPASAQDARPLGPLPPAALSDLLLAFADGLVASRAAEVACGDKALAADAAEGWKRGGRSLVASLKANELPADVVQAIEATVTPDPSGAGVECATDMGMALLGQSAGRNWREAIATQLQALGLKVVQDPPAPELMAKIRAVGERERGPQARMMACLDALQSVYFPASWSDWARLVGDVRALMLAADLPPAEVAAFADPLEPWALWKRPTAEERAALQRDCATDQAWTERAFAMTYYAFKTDIESILPKPAP